MVFHHQHSGLIDKPRVNLHLFDGVSFDGIDNLDPSLTINGTTKTPLFRFRGKDANLTDWPAWTYGSTVNAQGSGGMFNYGSPLLGSSDDGVNLQGTRFYDGPDNVFGDVATEDLVVELIVVLPSGGGTESICTKRVNDATSNGFYIWRGGGNTFSLFLKDASSTNATVATSNIADQIGSYVHAMCFVNRDEASTNGSQWYLDGVADGTGVDFSAVGSTTSLAPFKLGANLAGGSIFNDSIVYLAMWTQASWHQAGASGPTEWAAIAKDRCARLCGVYPVRARGTAIPNTMSRSSTAYIDKSDDYGTDEVANKADGLDNFTQIQQVTISPAPGQTSPDGREVFLMHEDATAATTHRAFDTVSVTIEDIFEISVVAKAINRSWIELRINAGGSAFPNQMGAFFNLSSGTVGTEYADTIDSGIDDLGQGWYRCWATAKAEATTTSPAAVLSIAEADNDTSFDGLDQDSIYATTPQVRIGPHRRLYPVGDNWLRQVRRKDSGGTEIKGYLAEGAATNLCLQSQDFSTTWTATRATVSTDTVTAPDDTVTADTLAEDGTAATTHLISQTISVSSGTQYAYSCFAKAANRSWFLLYNATHNAYCYFDLNTGAKGTQNVNVDEAGIEDWGNGWYRCWLTYTASATEAQSFQVLLAEADADNVFDGLTQDSLYLWQAQVEAGAYPSSIIPTTTATVTRSADLLQYKGDDGNIPNIQRGAMTCSILKENYDNATTDYIATLSDGGLSADQIIIYNATNEYFYCETAATAGAAGAANQLTDISDGVKKDLLVTWAKDALQVGVDGTLGTRDTSVDIPDDLDEVDVGMFSNNLAQFEGVISDLKFRG